MIVGFRSSTQPTRGYRKKNMISRRDGSVISELEHVYQSIEMILTTPIGSRVMRRDFGSHLPRLLGKPLNPQTVTAFYAAANEAIATWEPRVEVVATRMNLDKAKAGIVDMNVIFRLAGETFEREFRLS